MKSLPMALFALQLSIGSYCLAQEPEPIVLHENTIRKFEQITYESDMGSPIGKIKISTKRHSDTGAFLEITISYGRRKPVTIKAEQLSCIPNPRIEDLMFVSAQPDEHEDASSTWTNSILIPFISPTKKSEETEIGEVVQRVYPAVEFTFSGYGRLTEISAYNSASRLRTAQVTDHQCPKALIEWASQ